MRPTGVHLRGKLMLLPLFHTVLVITRSDKYYGKHSTPYEAAAGMCTVVGVAILDRSRPSAACLALMITKLLLNLAAVIACVYLPTWLVCRLRMFEFELLARDCFAGLLVVVVPPYLPPPESGRSAGSSG